MGLRVAVANGNWSNPATWNGGLKPAAGDVVASNNFTVTIDQNINVDTLTNAAQSIVDAVPDMTSNTSPSGIVSASDIPNPTTNDAFRAFDNSLSTWWSGGAVNISNPRWISYQFPNAIPINQYVIQGVNNGNEQGPKDWEFQGWNGSNWVTLHTVAGHNSNNYTSPLIGNSTAYLSYRLLITASLSTSIGVVNIILYETGTTSPAVAGGGFVLNNGVTVTCTNSVNGFNSGSNSINGLIVFSLNTGQSATLIGNAQVTILSNARVVYFNGTGTLNWVGNWESVGSGLNSEAIFINAGTNGGIVNFTGNMTINSSSIRPVININKIFTFNMTGDIDFLQSSGNNISGSPFAINTSFTFNIVGAIYGGRAAVINTTQVINFNQTGIMIARVNNANVSSVVFSSTNASSIHIMTGPFISDVYGTMPMLVVRMHYRRTIGSYFEFRDETTNGALPPATAAPAARLVSPDTVVDAPIPANVRNGVSYALGTLTGTLKVPSPNSVAFGVPTDNTTGLAVLTPEDVWNAQTSTMNTAGSIGNRLKNTATVDSTGDQLTSLL